MSDEATTPKPKKKSKLLLIGGAVVILAGGAGGGLYAGGMIGGSGQTAKKNLPQLVAREGVDRAEADQHASPNGDKKVDPSKFQASYYKLAEKFTSNLLDSSSFVQAELAVSTFYDQRVLDNVVKHETAVRSAVLEKLAEQDPSDLATSEGKDALKKELTTAVNRVLKTKEGFGGIDDVYFVSFVIQ